MVNRVELNLGPRPASSDADQSHEVEARKVVGQPKSGRVVVLSREVGTGYVQEERTGAYYAFARRFQPEFDSLREGMKVTFYKNRFDSVARFSGIR
jgi:hypothetical protein